MQNLLQISPSPAGSNGSVSAASTNNTLSQPSGSVSSEFDQVLETSINGVQHVQNAADASSSTSSPQAQSGLSLQQLNELKNLLLESEGNEFAEFDAVSQVDGASLPNLKAIIADLEALIDSIAQNGVGGLDSLNPELANNLSAGEINAGQLQDLSVSDLDGLLQQISEYVDALSSLGSNETPVLDEISAAVSALSSSLNNATNPMSQQGGSNIGSGVDTVQEQNSRSTINDLSLNSANNGSNSFNGGGGPGSEGSGNGSASDKFFELSNQKIAIADNAKDLDQAFSEQIKLASGKQGFTDLQSRLVNGADRAYATTVPTNVFEPEWGDDLSQKIVWMTSREIKSAEIHLNPAELGPIDLKVSVQSDNATVNINAQNATVRELLESQVVRLREMMEQNGISLDDVNVGAGEQEQMAQQDGNSEGGSASETNNGLSGNGDEDSAVTQEITSSPNLVDFYA